MPTFNYEVHDRQDGQWRLVADGTYEAPNADVAADKIAEVVQRGCRVSVRTFLGIVTRTAR